VLKVISRKDVVDVVTDMSGYTPFISEFIDERTPTPLYWRIGDFKSSLIEVGLNKRSGCISSVSLIMFNGGSVAPIGGREEQVVEVGMPVFDIQDWDEDRCLDIKCDFNILRGKGCLRLLFFSDVKLAKVYRNKSVDFGVGELGELIWIEFSSLDEVSLDELF